MGWDAEAFRDGQSLGIGAENWSIEDLPLCECSSQGDLPDWSGNPPGLKSEPPVHMVAGR